MAEQVIQIDFDFRMTPTEYEQMVGNVTDADAAVDGLL